MKLLVDKLKSRPLTKNKVLKHKYQSLKLMKSNMGDSFPTSLEYILAMHSAHSPNIAVSHLSPSV